MPPNEEDRSPKETANEHMAIFPRMDVALVGLEEIAFALCYMMIL